MDYILLVMGEDDIQHKILSTITKERILTVWKYKINNEIY